MFICMPVPDRKVLKLSSNRPQIQPVEYSVSGGQTAYGDGDRVAAQSNTQIKIAPCALRNRTGFLFAIMARQLYEPAVDPIYALDLSPIAAGD
jgi:hypothetical protein